MRPSPHRICPAIRLGGTKAASDEAKVLLVGAPVSAMKKWLELADIAKGPIFRGIARWSAFEDCADAQSTNLILKRLYAAAGLDPADFSARGLRASFTEAARRGDSLPEAMQESQHESSPTSGGLFCAREGGEARLISSEARCFLRCGGAGTELQDDLIRPRWRILGGIRILS
jgi:hypothetical protein